MNTNQQLLESFKAALAAPLPADDITKSFTQSGTATSGLTAYDLEAPAKLLYPVLTPLRNRITRMTGGKGIQANWRAITGINSSGVFPGVSEGSRNAAIAHTTADYLAAFKGLGFDDYVTFESDFSAQGFDDVKARAVEGLLRSLMIWEEFVDLGGNGTTALNGGNATPTPTVADLGTGKGTLTNNAAYNVYCIALTLAGYQQLAGWNNGVIGQTGTIASTTALRQTFSRVNMSGDTETINGGTAKPSLVGTVTTGNSPATATYGISAYVTAVQGAAGYAWYWGTSGNEALGAVTSTNSVVISAAAASTQLFSTLAATTDYSTDSLVYDGLIPQINKSGSGAYTKVLATGTPGTGTYLTTNGAGGIAEFDTAFQAFWNLYRLSPDTIYVNAQQLIDINAIVVKNGGAPLIRFNLDANNPNPVIDAGTVVGTILNAITNRKVSIVVHPNMAPGTVLFYSDSIPYPLSNVGAVVQKECRRDYYQIEWPITRRRYEYGIYLDGVLKNYFPPAFGVIQNIAPGHA